MRGDSRKGEGGGGGSRPHLKFHLPGSRPATFTFMMAKRTPVTRSPRYNNINHNEERGAQMVSERERTRLSCIPNRPGPHVTVPGTW